MATDKQFKSLIKAMITVHPLAERRQLNQVLRFQFGRWRLTRIAWRALAQAGPRLILSDLRRLRLDRLVAYFFVNTWTVLGSREAIIDGDRCLTFCELKNRVLQLANGLQALGAAPGDRIGCMLPNSAEFLECFYAACLIGTPLPTVNWHLTGSELATTINLRQPRIFIFHQDYAAEILAQKTELTSVDHFIMVGDETPPPGCLQYETLLQKAPVRMPRLNFIIALNPYTGGTTGTPKSANLHDGFSYLFSNTTAVPRTTLSTYLYYLFKEYSYFYHYGGTALKDPISRNIRALIVTPMYHAGTAAGYSPCILLGATAVIMNRFDPEAYLDAIARHRISWAFAVPTILQRILALPDEMTGRYNLSSMKTLICAAAPCPPAVKEKINALFLRQGAAGPVFHEYYGSAETGLITALIPADYQQKPERIRSVGKARCGDIMIYDDLQKREADPGQEGRVLGRTVSSMSLRYPGTESELKTNQIRLHGQEWYDDKLIGYLDSDGFLYLTGRIKEMIISGGVNVFPGEIEEILLNHAQIADAAVIRGPDPDLGEVPVACLQLNPGATLTETAVLDFCRQQGLKGFKLPRKVVFYEALPRHIDGKLIKRELEKTFWEEQTSSG